MEIDCETLIETVKTASETTREQAQQYLACGGQWADMNAIIGIGALAVMTLACAYVWYRGD